MGDRGSGNGSKTWKKAQGIIIALGKNKRQDKNKKFIVSYSDLFFILFLTFLIVF